MQARRRYYARPEAPNMRLFLYNPASQTTPTRSSSPDHRQGGVVRSIPSHPIPMTLKQLLQIRTRRPLPRRCSAGNIQNPPTIMLRMTDALIPPPRARRISKRPSRTRPSTRRRSTRRRVRRTDVELRVGLLGVPTVGGVIRVEGRETGCCVSVPSTAGRQAAANASVFVARGGRRGGGGRVVPRGQVGRGAVVRRQARAGEGGVVVRSRARGGREEE